MSVHALFRMARCLYPVEPQAAAPSLATVPAPSSPLPVPPPQNPPQVFRPSHALYSSITGRHAQLQRARAAYPPSRAAAGAQPALKTPDTTSKTPDSVPLEAT